MQYKKINLNDLLYNPFIKLIFFIKALVQNNVEIKTGYFVIMIIAIDKCGL